MTIQTKRIYDDVEASDGTRILVDRLWPRGVSKEEAQLDEWMKAVAPSDELREWFDHDPGRWDEFRIRYHEELDETEAVQNLIELADSGTVTLLYAASDREHNNAVALRAYLEKRLCDNAKDT